MKTLFAPSLIGSMLLLAGCGAPDQSATSCFNPNIYQDGNEYLMVELADNQPTNYRFTTLQTGNKPQSTGKDPLPLGKELQRTWLVKSGEEGMAISQTLAIDAENKNFALQSGEQDFLSSKIKREADGAPQLIDFNFANKGQSRSSNFSYLTESTLDNDPPQHVTLDFKQITTFHGIESLTTPAGTFSTCHMELKTEVKNAEDGKRHQLTVNTWYAQQLGIPVQLSVLFEAEPSPDQYQLIQAKVDDKTFMPTQADIEKLQLAEALNFAKSSGSTL